MFDNDSFDRGKCRRDDWNWNDRDNNRDNDSRRRCHERCRWCSNPWCRQRCHRCCERCFR